MRGSWRASTWGDEISLEYGKALRDYADGVGSVRVYGSNGPIGWTDKALENGPGVILGRKGAYRGVEYSPGPFHVIDTGYYLVPKTDLDFRWLYYAVKHYKLGDIDDGSPIPSTTRSAVYVQDVEVPSLPEQVEIGRVLGAFDDKIELNRQLSETLEEMARALFKSWFVDFDIVRAKVAGRDPRLRGDLFSLFPDSFDDSERGEIPKGWRVGGIGEVAEVIYGAPFASDQFNTSGFGKPLVRIRDLFDESPGVWTPEVHPKGYILRAGDIVVGMDGEFRAYLWGGDEAWLNQRVCVFAPRGGAGSAFVRNSIMQPLAGVEATETATTVIHLGKGDIDGFRIVLPPSSVLSLYEKLSQPLYDRIVATKRESRTLRAQRDALIPRLLSGELKVPPFDGAANDA